MTAKMTAHLTAKVAVAEAALAEAQADLASHRIEEGRRQALAAEAEVADYVFAALRRRRRAKTMVALGSDFYLRCFNAGVVV